MYFFFFWGGGKKKYSLKGEKVKVTLCDVHFLLHFFIFIFHFLLFFFFMDVLKHSGLCPTCFSCSFAALLRPHAQNMM